MKRGRPKGNKTERKPKKELIKLTLKLLGRTYEATGKTLDEAIDGLKTHNWIKGAGVLIFEKGKIRKEKIIAGNHIKNIFGLASGTMRAVSLKWVKSIFE